MIIWGRTGREIEQEWGEFHCPRCKTIEEYKRVRVATYFTLYFIPLFETQYHGDYVECLGCLSQFNPDVLDERDPTGEDPGLHQVREVRLAERDPRGDDSDLDQDREFRRAARYHARGFEEAKAMVKGPAILLIIFGFLGLIGNLSVAGYSLVDEFVMPLRVKGRDQRGAEIKVPPVDKQEEKQGNGPNGVKRDPAALVTFFAVLFGFSVASGLTIGSGFSMLALRRYWLCLLGSLAIMPGTCICCMLGAPIGVWSLVVLLNPRVSSAFG